VILLAVPNVSEGRDPSTIEQIGRAWGGRLLDTHTDPDHHRSVYTLAGDPGELSHALLAGARAAIASIDLNRHAGVHPRIGAIDVVPIVHLDDASRGAACAEALVTADLLGEDLALPVFLYGALGGGRTRAELRRGGLEELARRIPDFGPREPHPTAGAVLVAARPPLVAFNLELSPPVGEEEARQIARRVREDLPGVRALGLWLATSQTAQVSFNVEDPTTTPLRAIVAATQRHAPVAAAELVGLAPRAALEGFPDDVPLPGFDPDRHLIENVLGF
jgi:glutamate formiminotransferase / 5-formyltetrahydrofolate cyclo-ligase